MNTDAHVDIPTKVSGWNPNRKLNVAGTVTIVPDERPRRLPAGIRVSMISYHKNEAGVPTGLVKVRVEDPDAGELNGTVALGYETDFEPRRRGRPSTSGDDE